MLLNDDDSQRVHKDKNYYRNFGGLIMKMWIARTPNNGLYVFNTKPFWREDLRLWCEQMTKSGWITAGYIFNSDLFPEVTFENSPMEVELKLVSNENS